MKNAIIQKLIVIWAVVILMVFAPARTIYVDANGTGDYPTIQDASVNSKRGKLVAFGNVKFDQRQKCSIRLMKAGAGFGLVLGVNGQLVAWGENSNGECEVPSGNDFTSVSCGSGYALALKTNGTVVAWGDNRRHQCEVPDGNDFVAISTHQFYSVALRSDGTIVTWGDNDFHPDCGSPPGYQESMIELPDTNDCVAIAAGYYHGLSLKSDGSIVAWGNNGYNQCEVPDSNDFAAIAAGEFHSIALRRNGQLSAWGNNYYGQCNVPDGNDYVDITAGDYFSIALKSDGSIVSFGNSGFEGQNQLTISDNNDFVAISACGYYALGQKSDGSITKLTQYRYTNDFPHQFNRNTTGNYVKVVSDYYELALRADGTLVGWGSNNGHGELNIPDGNDFIDIAVGHFHGLALRSNGTIESWGWNGYGQQEVPEASDYIDIACGSHHCLAIREPGVLVAWGADRYGQCDVPDGNDFVDVEAGGGHSLAIRSDGSLVCWGNNDYGQCNVPEGNDFVAISVGGGAVSCALKSDGTIVAWGHNDLGRLNVPKGKDYIDISENMACLALTSSGRIVPWGARANQWNIPDCNDFTAIASAMYYGLAITKNEYPVAVAGPNQVAYAFINGLADVTLDGSASYDDDNDVLDYYWSWYINSNLFEAHGISPTIQLPVGEHQIELIVDDGIDLSEPDYCTVTVIGPLRTWLWLWPTTINCGLRPQNIITFVYLPKDIELGDINDEPLTMYPCDIQSKYHRVFRMGHSRYAQTVIMAVFDKDQICDYFDAGWHKVEVAGRLRSGRYFCGSDMLRITGPNYWHGQQIKKLK
jgi:alpha-tubulin suppressor-like RCC1 family protein